MREQYGHLTSEELLADQHHTLYERHEMMQQRDRDIDAQLYTEALDLTTHIKAMKARRDAIFKELGTRRAQEGHPHHYKYVPSD